MDQQYLHYLYDDSSDSDDELDHVGNPRRRNEDYLEETVVHYSEEEFYNHFRISRNVASQITQKFESSRYYDHRSGQFGKISALNQVLIFLWYIGHQTASFADVTDRFNITKSSLDRIINRVTVFLSNLSEQIICWPSDEEKVQIEREFHENGFGNVIGAIDGSHVKIDKPRNDPDSYINRKGYYSVQMQVVCDKRLRIRDIFVGYPGSVHDSRVFRNSPLYETLPAKCGEYFILGDSGYLLKANLLTPFRDRGELNNRQLNYNMRLATNRYVIEHSFGVLKQKFRQLYHVKLQKIEYIVHLIRAACVLHNLALDDKLLLVEDEEIIHPHVNNKHDNMDNEEEFDGDGDARRIRDAECA